MMKSSGLLRGLAVLIACAATACGDARSAEGDDSNAPGKGRVVNTAPKWRGGEAWALSARPVLVVGGSESDSVAALYGVAGAVRLSDGRIVVADRGASGLRIYDSRGEHLLTSGGKGSGPGEFDGVDALAKIRGDTLLVWDRKSARVSVFDATGKFVDSRRPTGLNALPWFAGAFRDGSFAVSTGVSPSQMMAQSGSTRQDTMVILHVGRQGEVLDTIGRFAGPETFVDMSGGNLTVERVIFGESSSLAVGADRFIAGTNTNYQLTAYTPAGESALTIVKQERRRPASKADVDAYRQYLLSRNLGNVPAEVRASASRRVAAIPHRESLPSFGDIRVDNQGYLWVAQFGVPGQAGKWDIFDPSGVWLGTLEVPGDLTIQEIGPDYVLGVATDELGVERVEMYSLQRKT
jgi:hypothetical protein